MVLIKRDQFKNLYFQKRIAKKVYTPKLKMKSICFTRLPLFLYDSSKDPPQLRQNKQPNDRPLQEQYCSHLIKYYEM